MRSSVAACDVSCCLSSAAAAAMLLTGDHSMELSVGSSPAQPQNVFFSAFPDALPQIGHPP